MGGLWNSKCKPYTTSTDAGMSSNSEGGWWCSLKSTGGAPESDLWETVSMPKRNLRIVTRGATIPVLGICEYCNAQFKSNEPLKDDAKAELRAQFRRAQMRTTGGQPKRRADRERVYGKKLDLLFILSHVAAGSARNFRHDLASRRAEFALYDS